MCNTKNTEIIRQQLWCDVYTSYLKEMSHLESVKGANRAVEEFDKNFNSSLLSKEQIVKIKGFDVEKAISTFKNNQDSFE